MVIVQEQGITAAANRLELKQPTVSNALKRLETCLGSELIQRGPRSFEVTAQGQIAVSRVHLDLWFGQPSVHRYWTRPSRKCPEPCSW